MGHAPTGDVSGYTRSSFTAVGLTHTVLEKGTGPGVVVLPELPGIVPEVFGLTDEIVAAGFTVVMPELFGTTGKELSGRYVAGSAARACVTREFQAFALNADRPIANYTRALAADLNARTPGPGVGVIGMCFSGGFALAAAADASVLAAVGSQPSVPFPVGAARKGDPGMSEGELATLVQRTRTDNLCLMGLRFSEDKASTADRFSTLRARLGDAFEVIELDSSPGNPDGFKTGAHTVLTHEVRTDPPNGAGRARARVLAFLKENLQG